MTNEDQYIPYHAARELLVGRLKATPEEIAAWLWDGWCEDCENKTEDKPAPEHVLRGYTHVHELNPPPRFVFHIGEYVQNLNSAMTGCYFIRDEITRFAPKERYVTAPAFIEELAGYTGSREEAEALIQSRIYESMIMGRHPNTGLTQWEDANPACAPKDLAIFRRSDADMILKEFDRGVPPDENAAAAAVEQVLPAIGKEAQSSDDAIPGKMPRTAIGKLAVNVAWEIECATGKRAIASQVINKLQELEKDEPILTEKIPHGVKWVTSKGKGKSFDVQTCAKALETWNTSRNTSRA